MTFELAPYSLALFEDDEIRKTKKSAFYDLFPEMTVNVNNVQKFSYVIDVGMLIHRCRCQKNTSKSMERTRRSKKKCMYVMTSYSTKTRLSK